jgi:nucleoside-diphosphate-sugar epimerase
MTTLITGGGGYLGRRIAAALRDEEVILAGHSVEPSVGGRTSGVRLDLREEDPLSHVDPRRITRIVHAAAVTRFDVDRDTAWRVNVAGTARVREFAERCGRLQRFVHLSTLYTVGRRRGEVHEVRHRDAGFVNHYEWSKWAAEECLLAGAGPPVTVVRLPTVVAEDDGGAIGRYNAFHHTLRLYHHGLLTLLPGDPTTPLYLAPASFAVGAVTALLDAEPGIYHACPEPIPLGATVDTAFAVFTRDGAFRRRMLPRPTPCDLDSFHDLVAAARGLRGGPLHAAIAAVAPFAEQLYLPKVFRSDRLRAAWPGYRAPDPVALVRSVCTDLVVRRGRVPA